MNAIRRSIKRFTTGTPIAIAWVWVFVLGAFQFGILSIPSEGTPEILPIAFLVAAGIGGLGAATRHLGAISASFSVMIVSSLLRAYFLWGVSQNGAGSNYIATFVWIWIAIITTMALIAICFRGVQGTDDA